MKFYLASKFINNTDLVWRNDTLKLKLGGACLFKGQYMYVNSSYFEKNNGLIGGALTIVAENYKIQNTTLENCIFKENYSGNGGAIGITDSVLTLSMLIRKNYFYGNWGACKFFFYI